MKKLLGSLVLSLVLLGGCAKAPLQHPGSVNAFDSAAYDTVIISQAAIEEADKQFGSTPSAKPILDRVKSAYNTVAIAYKSYHNGAVAGTVTADQKQGFQNQLDALKEAMTELKGLKK